MVILLESFLAKLFVIEISSLPGNVNLSAGGEIPLNCLPIQSDLTLVGKGRTSLINPADLT